MALRDSPLHFKPSKGRLCDTIPFYHNGEYHVFYLVAETGPTMPWEHAVSTDLKRWTELPRALESDPEDPIGPDGFNMFTGCVVESEGIFHIFYTGHNPRNPDGTQFICHATSPDLIAWTKHREHCFRADGIIHMNRDFRDPHVFWNPEDSQWWMLLCACDADTGFSFIGRAVSTDLTSWRQVSPLIMDPMPLEGETGAPECPDLFRIGDCWHLLYTRRGQNIRRSRHIMGPYTYGSPSQLDTKLLLAGKSLYDGRRHIYFGPLSGDYGDTVMNLPRELYQGSDGHLWARPAAEIIGAFEMTDSAGVTGSGDASAADIELGEPSWQCEAPVNYMAEFSVELAPESALKIGFRKRGDGTGGRDMKIRPDRRSVEMGGFNRAWGDDELHPIEIRAFVLGTVIEVFINDRFAFVSRVYESEGRFLTVRCDAPADRLLSMSIKTPD